MFRRKIFLSLSLVVMVSLLPISVIAGSVTSNGITLSWPEFPLTGPARRTCEPWNDPSVNTIALSGLPEGASVTVVFAWSSPYTGAPNFLPPINYPNVSGGGLVIAVPYPTDTSTWPVWDPATNERAIAVAAFINVTANGVSTKLKTKQWWIQCIPPSAPAQGCTPGYWRQDQHFDSWVPTGFAPGDDFNTVFGVTASFDPHTLLDAVWLGGGGENALARHAVAALLNASHPDLNYFYTPQEIIDGVQDAYATGDFETFKSLLDFANNAGCPLN